MFKRLDGMARGDALTIYFDGRPIQGYEGETLASVMLAGGILTFRKTMREEAPRGFFCGMGICNECLVELEDGTRVRACQTPARDGMKIRSITYPAKWWEE